MKFLLTLLLLPLTLWGQTWTNPVNISPNLPGLDNQPDLCIDKNGILHCVFTHKLESNWRKIYYSKSIDDGVTWTTPEDISLNPDTSLMNPHIIADTNNKLYVTYDYNTGNPAMTLIYLRIFEGIQWSQPFLISEGMHNSDHNLIYVDYNNRIYVFWFYINQLMYYRYFENNNWSDTICPYPGDHNWGLLSAVIDDNNDIHCIGSYSDAGPPIIPQSKIYFKYDYLSNNWTDKTTISVNVSGGGSDIDVDEQNNPHIAWRQKTIDTSPNEDSTMYTFFNGNFWSEPELVVNDPYEQRIAIDPYNRVHIIDREKLEIGYKLVHYQKYGNLWQGYIVDESQIVVNNPTLIEKNNILYMVYYNCFNDDDCKIMFAKNYLTTGVNTKTGIFKEINIYPNPFETETTIELKTNKQQQIDISIFDLNGRHVKTIENKEFSPGTYKYKWFGTDKNRKEVKAGLYLVQLLTGRHVITKLVEKISK